MALDGVNLTVPAGSLTVLLGPSGCGKSTLLRLIAGFDRPKSGTVEVGGRALTGPGLCLPPEKRGVGIVPQDQALFPHMDVAANVGYGLKRSTPNGADRLAQMMSLAGLEGLAQRMPHELSGGEQQRVALARALAPAPAVVLLDEPFANLDAALRVMLRAQVRQILTAAGTTAVVVTHDQQEALSLADQVVVMREGRVVQAGPPAEVYRRPADPWVARFVGQANLVIGKLDGSGQVQTSLGSWPLAGNPPGAPGSEVTVLIRPEQIGLDAWEEASAGSPWGVVTSLDYFGHDCLTGIRCWDGTDLVARSAGSWVPGVGDQVALEGQGEALAFAPPS
ncbi:MAG: ABC transporter ATP-binding protein [Acidimicrobiales bacterium]